MFNLGPMEILMISAAALLVLGPKRLPELAKGLGKGIRDFKKALEGQDDEEKKTLPTETVPTKSSEASQSADTHDSTPKS